MIKIDILVFIISLFLGLFVVYVTAPKPNVVFKYPNINSANKITYIDENNTCYRYIPKPVECKK